MDLNSYSALLEHRKIIRKKTFLKKLYFDFYQEFTNASLVEGKIIELGSGAGFLKELMPHVVTSDVIDGPDIDKVFFADKIPFKSSSVAAFLMMDVLHHIKDPKRALREMERCLKKGGKIIMIEPYISAWGSFIYKYIHPEKKGFNPKAGWKIKGNGRMTDANPAMAWIIFKRDRKLFEKKFPNLKIIRFDPHTPLRYLISGGLFSFQLLPTAFYPFIIFLEKKLEIFNEEIGMFVTIELQKISLKNHGSKLHDK